MLKCISEQISDIWYQGRDFRLKLKENSSVKKAEEFPTNSDFYFSVGADGVEFTLVLEAAAKVTFVDDLGNETKIKRFRIYCLKRLFIISFFM